jgi:hypothetical protein
MELLIVGFLALLLTMVAATNRGEAPAQVVTVATPAPPRSGGGGTLALVMLIIVGLLVIGTINLSVVADKDPGTPTPSVTPTVRATPTVAITPTASVTATQPVSKLRLEISFNKW